MFARFDCSSSSSLRSSDGQSRLLDEGSSALQVLQGSIEFLGGWQVVRPDPLPGRLVEGAGLE